MIGPLQRSLKTRVTLFSLAIFALSLWALAYYASKMLRTDMEQLLGDQQRSTVALMAANIDQELKDRLTALERIAGDFDEKELKSPALQQSNLERRSILPLLFNGGYFVTDAAGITTASVPVTAGRIGINYLPFDNVAAALGEGKSAIGALGIGKVLQVPVFSLAVPIRDAQGKVIGSLVGVINLSTDNFLHTITSNTYGRTGGYVLVDRQQRLIVTATDKSRILEALPPVGVSPEIDNFLAGREGSAIFRNPQGEEVLASVKNIPVVGWYVAATLPTAEAFAPIHDMQQRMLLATILLTLIAGALTWWMLRRQLAPMGAAAAALGARAGPGLTAEPLLVTTNDEIGQLVSSFNRLLEELATREQALKSIENRFSLFMEYFPGIAFIKDEDGTLLYANRNMRDLLGTSACLGKSPADFFPPEVAEKMVADDRRAMAVGCVITEEDLPAQDGHLRHFETHKFSISRSGQPPLLGGIALDVSARKQAEDALRRTVKDLRETQRIAHIGNWRLDLTTNEVVWSEELYEMYGFDPSLPVPPYTEHMKLFTPDSWERLNSALAQTGETGVPYTLELETIRNDGSTGWMWVQGEAEVDSAGKTIGLWGAAQDITERKRAENDIRVAEVRFRAIIEASPIPFALNDSALNITYLNRAFIRTFGYDRKDIPTVEAWWPKAYPDELNRQKIANEWMLRVDRAKRDAKPFEPMEVKIRCKDGGERTVLATATPLGSSSNDLHVVTLYDITERKQAEQAALEALGRVDRLAQHVPGMLYQFHLRPDGSSHFPYTSDGIKDIYGVLPEQVGNDAGAVFKVIHPDDLQPVSDSIQASAQALSDWNTQYRVNLPDGRTIWVEGESSPEATPDGGVLWHGHIRDITERKATESLLLEQLDELHRWQQTMLGRESRIISMKQEVNELLVRSGQPPRYAAQQSAEPGEGDA